jgi:hypothetical protein
MRRHQARQLEPWPKNMWLYFLGVGGARASNLRGRPASFLSAPAMPLVWRVNCTAEASARSRAGGSAGLDQPAEEQAE